MFDQLHIQQYCFLVVEQDAVDPWSIQIPPYTVRHACEPQVNPRVEPSQCDKHFYCSCLK